MRYLTALLAACLSVASFASDVLCLDPLACNFMEEGECFFTDENGEPCVVEGCTIEGACNFNPAANLYDGSCEFDTCLGCTDSSACNYDENALYDDGSCAFEIDCNGVCGGDWIEDACGNCFSWTLNDEFSQYDFQFSGEIVEFAMPFDASVLITVAGASGGGTSNTGTGAILQGTFYLTTEDEISILVGEEGSRHNNGGGYGGGGGTFVVLNGEPLIIAGGGGGAGVNGHIGIWNGHHAQSGEDGHNGDSWGNSGTSYYTNGGIGGTDGNGGNYGIELQGTPNAGGGGGFYGSAIDPSPLGASSSYVKGGKSFLDGGLGGGTTGGFGGGGGGIWIENSCGGGLNMGGGGGGGYSGGGGGGGNCNDPGGGGGSFNSDPDALPALTSENGHHGHGYAVFELLTPPMPYCNPGCMHPLACNYNPESNFDDGSCDYCFCGEGTQWVDSLQACMVNEETLMQACGEGTYWDDLAHACLTIETCQVDLDGDGVIGVSDLLELLSSFGTECDPEPETAEWACGDPVNYYGYDYATVLIGEQCWFSENLKTEHYKDGTNIEIVTTASEWTQLMHNTGVACAYNYDYSNISTYGLLYNPLTFTEQLLCPTGWSVPLEGQWEALIEFLGGYDNAGGPLKASGTLEAGDGLWLEPNLNGTNSSGFSALPSGYNFNGGFQFGPDYPFHFCYMWASGGTNGILANSVTSNNGTVAYGYYGNQAGFAVRCILD